MVAGTILLGVISALCYDVLKNTGVFAKDKFIEYAIQQQPDYDESFISSVADELEELNLDDEMSEKAISKRIESKSTLVNLINTYQPKTSQNLVQNNIHGDNIAGDKIINN